MNQIFSFQDVEARAIQDLTAEVAQLKSQLHSVATPDAINVKEDILATERLIQVCIEITCSKKINKFCAGNQRAVARAALGCRVDCKTHAAGCLWHAACLCVLDFARLIFVFIALVVVESLPGGS